MTETSRRQAQIVDQSRENVALAQQPFGALGEPVQAGEKCRRGARLAQRFDPGAGCGEHVERNVDPVEIEIIVLAVLQMIDDLQGGA